MCEAMEFGNGEYEDRGLSGYLSCAEVCQLEPPIGVPVEEDTFFQPGQIKNVLCKLEARAEKNRDGLAAAVLVISPLSFCPSVHLDMFLLFDSHQHHPHGALLTLLPCSSALEYLSHFFTVYYPQLHFDGSVPGKYGQLSFLGIH